MTPQPLALVTPTGRPASRLGLGAHPEQPAECVPQALARGINYFFFYSREHSPFLQGLKPLLRTHRDELIVACGSEARTAGELRAERLAICDRLATETLDVFFAEYVAPNEPPHDVFGRGGTLDELQRWKAAGWIRYVGASAHHRELARQLAADPRVDVLMHRFNLAHRKARQEVFPTVLASGTPVVAFTATRWGALLEPHPDWPGRPPSAAECYRYCLAEPAVRLVLTAPRSPDELEENLVVLTAPAMPDRQRARWEGFGDLVYGTGTDAFETSYP